MSMGNVLDQTAESQLAPDRRASDILERAAFCAYKTALNQQAIVSVTDRAGRITDVNEQFTRISGYSDRELIGATHRIVNSGYHSRAFFHDMWTVVSRGAVWRGDVRNRMKDGRFYWVDTTIAPVQSDDGVISGYVSIRFDITRRKNAEAELTAENEKRYRAEVLLRDIIDSIPNGITAFNESGRLALYNSEFLRFFNVSAPAIQPGAQFADIMRYAVANGQFASQPNTTVTDRWLKRRLVGHQNPGKPVIEHLSDGRWLQVQERRSRAGYIVGVRTDITELKRAEQRIHTQATRDPLTGLFNRHVLQERLAAALPSQRRRNGFGAVVLIDLDHFKDINDTMGHDAGDHLLINIGERLNQVVRKRDTVARLGGDEFAIILPMLRTRQQGLKVVDRIRTAIGSPLELGHRSISPKCSIGVVFYPFDAESAKEALKNADIALYRAKGAGRGTHCFFESGMRTELEEREQLADHLREALRTGQIDIALQPQITLADGKHSGFEALARWTRAGQPIPPSVFIPLAEETGLIVPLGHTVLEKSLQEFARLEVLGLSPGSISVNVSAIQLKRPGFAADVLKLLAKHRVATKSLELEVTENVMLGGSTERVIETLQALRDSGIRLALDDFGTGYASLSHLTCLRFDRIKIDRTFVSNIRTSEQDAAIVKAILSLGESLGIEVVVEGIEDEEQLYLLQKHKCQYGQGYLIARPMHPTQVQNYLRNQEMTRCRFQDDVSPDTLPVIGGS